MTRIEALALAQAAFAEGEARGVTRMSAVVTDGGGHVRVAMRGDGQGIFGVETATAKAATALGFNRPTLALTPLFSPQAVSAINGAVGGRFAPLGGGVVFTGETGGPAGALGVSGGLPEVDDAIARAAVAACDLNVLE